MPDDPRPEHTHLPTGHIIDEDGELLPPTAEQERAWDERDDEQRGHTLTGEAP